MKLQELHSYIQEHQPNICQISVLQSGNELYSAEWNGYQRTDCVHIASATKSVMALLIASRSTGKESAVWTTRCLPTFRSIRSSAVKRRSLT